MLRTNIVDKHYTSIGMSIISIIIIIIMTQNDDLFP